MRQSNSRILTKFIILVLCFSLTGCAGLQRKFVRKKKQQDRVAPVVTTRDYSKGLRVAELYKKHFLFWKAWQLELIDRLDAAYKKRVSCYDYTVDSLMEMKKYMRASKAEELDPFIKDIESMESLIKKKRLTKSQKYKIKQVLERTRRQIEKKFSYEDVKDHLELQNTDDRR